MTGIIATGSTTDPIFANSFTLIPPANTFINIPTTSIFPGVFITYTAANGQNVLITDSGVFLSSGQSSGDDNVGDLYGLLIESGLPPFGHKPLSGNAYTTTASTVNYATGEVNVTFPSAPPADTPIQAQCYFYQQGIPRSILFYNNTITIRPPPDTQYLIEMDAYLTPAAFLSTSQALPFAYMAEYIARGAARKILSDTGDIEQFQFYEPLFREQELLVWKRSQRINTSTRTPTIYSDLSGQSPANNYAGGT